MSDITTYQEQIDQLEKQQDNQMRIMLSDFRYFASRCDKIELQIDFIGYCLMVLLGVLSGLSIALIIIRFNIL